MKKKITTKYIRQKINDLVDPMDFRPIGSEGNYGYGSNSTETFPTSFPMTRKSKVYLNEGEIPPNKEQIYQGPRGGKFYNSDITSKEEGIFYHGTAWGQMGNKEIHIGTYKAAKQALEARIGVPAEGEWDGTREYGKTLLAGKKTLKKIDPKGYNITGYNVTAPEEDYYPENKEIPLTMKPNILKVRIKGNMTNTPQRPHSDTMANSLIRRDINANRAKRGYYYKNDGEDEGSISAVVPNKSHLEIINSNIEKSSGWSSKRKVISHEERQKSIERAIKRGTLDLNDPTKLKTQIKKEIDNLLKDFGGVGTISSGSGITPTFGGGNGQKMDFFNTKKKIKDIIKEHQPNPPWPNTVFDENKHRWVSTQENNEKEESIESTEILKTIGSEFKKNNFELYEVGGSVRDSLLGKKSDDLDLTTNAKPEQTKQLLSKLNIGSVFNIGEAYGTIGLMTKDKKIEITTFRGEVYPTSSRKPEVKFGNSLKEDLARRDFTFNAMAKDINTGELIDLFDGQEDLKNKKIKTVGNSKERFAEDPLRMMRAVRFAAQLGFDIESEMPEPEKLNNISKERINEELSKILKSNNPVRGIEYLNKFRLMKYIIPEVEGLKGITQNKHHLYDVHGHTMKVIENASKMPYKGQDKVVIMLAALLHDVGKPESRTESDGEVHFYDHQTVGAEKAKKILTNLKFDNNTIDRVVKLVELHMDVMMNIKSPKDVTDKFMTKLIRKVGDNDAPMLMDLAASDMWGSKDARPDITNALREKAKEILNTVKPSEITSPLSGDEIMNKFSLKPGKTVGKIKDELTSMVIDGELKQDDKENAYKIAEDIIQQNSLKKSILLDSIDSLINKARIYISDPSEAPEGTQVMQGKRGGLYYEGEKPKKTKSNEEKILKPKKQYITTPSGCRVPPAWTDVKIAKNKDDKVQATGYDSKGRKVTIYSAKHVGTQKVAKFNRLKSFTQIYPKIVSRIEQDREKSEEASVLYLISITGFRPGSDRETLSKVKAYGATTLEGKHIKVNGDKISFDFIGKKGVHITKTIKDSWLANKLKNKKDNEKLFDTGDYEVRKYLDKIPYGSKYNIKDFRTRLASEKALSIISHMKKPTNKKEFKKFVNFVGTEVAKELGNTKTVAINSYIAPEIFMKYEVV